MKIYTITEERLLALLKAEDELNALTNAGVDNWDGCSYAEYNWGLREAEETIPENTCLGKGVSLHGQL